MKQFVLPPGSRRGDRVVLTGRDYHYLVRVRRIATAETLSALDGAETLRLEVVAISETDLTLRVVEAPVAAALAGPRLVLYPFLLKARKLDDVVRQACEAGVSEIVPVEGDHCVARLDDDGRGKVERWNAIAREAAQQSGHRRVVTVADPIRSRDLGGHWATRVGSGDPLRSPLLMFHQVPLDKGHLHRYLGDRPETVGLVVGPEGGLSDAEVSALRAAGALPVWLGPFVLRAETASLYAVAAVNTILQESQEWTIPS